MDPRDILQLSATDLAARIRTARVSAVSAMEAVLERAAQAQAALNCFLRIDAEGALQAAHRAESDVARGLVRGRLHGVPLAHKDMFDRAGVAPSCGSLAGSTQPPPTTTATVLRRLDEAGAIQFGALAMNEFAYGPTGHNAHFGACANPWDTRHIPGGSSSGAGAAVAARATFGALGSDTGGSIRIPAALCGTTGIKPTYGRVSLAGAMSLSSSVDTVGPLARTVADCALLLQCIAGPDDADPRTGQVPVADYMEALRSDAGKDLRGVRIGTCATFFHDGIDGQIDAALRESLQVFQRLGAEVVQLDVPMDLEGLQATITHVIASEAAYVHRERMRERPQDYSEQVRARLQIGRSIPAYLYLEAIAQRSRAIARFNRGVFSKVDYLHAPTVGIRTPTLHDADAGGGSKMASTILSLTRLTRLFNYLGLPALTVPAGFTEATAQAGELPVGMQLVGPWFDEAGLFRVANAYQRVTDWHLRAPPIAAFKE